MCQVLVHVSSTASCLTIHLSIYFNSFIKRQSSFFFQARSAMARGDIASAQAHARSAKSMIIISVVVGGIAYIALGIIIGVYVGIIMSSRFSDFD